LPHLANYGWSLKLQDFEKALLKIEPNNNVKILNSNNESDVQKMTLFAIIFIIIFLLAYQHKAAGVILRLSKSNDGFNAPRVSVG